MICVCVGRYVHTYIVTANSHDMMMSTSAVGGRGPSGTVDSTAHTTTYLRLFAGAG